VWEGGVPSPLGWSLERGHSPLPENFGTFEWKMVCFGAFCAMFADCSNLELYSFLCFTAPSQTYSPVGRGLCPIPDFFGLLSGKWHVLVHSGC